MRQFDFVSKILENKTAIESIKWAYPASLDSANRTSQETALDKCWASRQIRFLESSSILQFQPRSIFDILPDQRELVVFSENFQQNWCTDISWEIRNAKSDCGFAKEKAKNLQNILICYWFSQHGYKLVESTAKHAIWKAKQGCPTQQQSWFVIYFFARTNYVSNSVSAELQLKRFVTTTLDRQSKQASSNSAKLCLDFSSKLRLTKLCCLILVVLNQRTNDEDCNK